MSFVPLLLAMLSIAFWVAVSTYKKKYSYLKIEMVATVIILIFLAHPTLIKFMFSAMNCTEIETG